MTELVRLYSSCIEHSLSQRAKAKQAPTTVIRR